MTIKEMHIEVEQSLQKVAANRTREYLPEELDWVLNKMQHRFIQLHVKPKNNGGYSLDQLGVDAIRPLIVSGRRLPAFIEDKTRYKCFLPSDYAYLISDASLVSDLCAAQSSESSVKIYITWLKQLKTIKVNPPYYETLSLTVNTDTLSIPTDLPFFNEYKGYNDKNDVMFLVPWIAHYFNQLGKTETGYEKYGEYYKPGHYYFVSANSQPNCVFVQDGANTTVKVEEEKTFNTHVSLENEQKIANRLESSENVQNLLGTSFYTTSVHSPISELSGNLLYIYYDNSFTVNSCEITYIRKPRILSLFLGSDCELAPEFHPTICDMATEYIKGRLENAQGQQLVERDNETRVII